MIIDTPINKDPDNVYYPKMDNNKLYSTIFIFIAIIAIYVSILTHHPMIVFLVIIPILYLSRAEEVKQGKRNFLQNIRDIFSQIGKMLYICAIFALTIVLMFIIGIFYTVILVFVIFKLYRYVNSTITRKNFEKNRSWKIEAS